MFSLIKEKVKLEQELKEITNKIKSQVNSVDISELSDYTYKDCKNLYKQIQYYIEDKKLLNELSIDDLELLKSIGIVEKKYNFRCKSCGSSCDIISESYLEKYKRYWELFELEKQNVITHEQLDELDQLEKDGFYEIYLCCIYKEECEDVEITNEKELSDYMKNIEVVYKVVKNPDLTYEKL